MRMARFFAGGILLLLACLQPNVGLAVTLGQMDDFQDGTIQGWGIGVPIDPAQPVNVPDGGPAGTGDRYMRLTAEGDVGSGGRLAVLNRDQWTGNYLAAGINAITMWVNNLGATDLALRLYLTDFATQFPINAAISTLPVLLPAHSGWTAVVFRISAADLTATVGSVQAALTDARELRLLHNPNPTFPPPRVVASLGVDNIKAVRHSPLNYLPLLLLDD